jgi:hypothetical protein
MMVSRLGAKTVGMFHATLHIYTLWRRRGQVL